MEKEILLANKIKIICSFGDNRLSDVFDLAHDNEIQDIVNTNNHPDALIQITSKISIKISELFEKIKQNIKLPTIFTDIFSISTFILPVLIDNKKESSLILRIENIEMGIIIINLSNEK